MEKNTFFFAPDEEKLKREYHNSQSSSYIIVPPTQSVASPIKVNYKITAKPYYKKPLINKFYSGLKISCILLLIINLFLYVQLMLHLL